MRDQSTRDPFGKYVPVPLSTRFDDQHEPEPTTGCWLWLGVIDHLGYGHIEKGGRNAMAHRVGYELLRGPIPQKMTLDHLCRNRQCVNPGHLEPVPQRVNVLRGNGVAALKAQQTHCVNGHEFTPTNTIIRNGRHRACRLCGRNRTRSHRAR